VSMVIIWTLWSFILSMIIAPIMGKKGVKAEATI
jgi:hypothetical protein